MTKANSQFIASCDIKTGMREITQKFDGRELPVVVAPCFGAAFGKTELAPVMKIFFRQERHFLAKVHGSKVGIIDGKNFYWYESSLNLWFAILN